MMDKLMMDEHDEMLKQIINLTKQGKIDWECVEYNPLSFMNKDVYDESSAYLCQMFKLEARIEGIPYELDLAEYITVPDGKGDVAVTLRRNIADDFYQIDDMVSGDLDEYEECSPEEIAAKFGNSPAMSLSNILVPQFASADAVMGTFEWARFINETGIEDELLNHPITRLAKKLFDEHRVLDYHRIVFDIAYREKLIAD